jgi:hypothetical protein
MEETLNTGVNYYKQYFKYFTKLQNNVKDVKLKEWEYRYVEPVQEQNGDISSDMTNEVCY